MSEDINNLLDMTLDDLEDLPEFKPYPAGAHRVLLTLSTKEVNKHPCVEVACKLIETLELSEPTRDEAPKPGAVANILCMMDNEYGRGNLKMIVGPIGLALGKNNVKDIVESAKNIECIIVTSIKVDKNDKTIERMNIKAVTVV